jgi:hypothetical protein
LALGIIFVKDNVPTEDYPLDYLSVVLSIVGCAGVMLGFTNVADFGFTHYLVILPIIIGIIALILFVKVDLPEPVPPATPMIRQLIDTYLAVI